MLLINIHYGRLIATAIAALFAAASVAADEQPAVDPKLFGFDIPAGRVVAGGGEDLLIRDNDGRDVVARLHATVGENAIVMLPDGRLVARRRDETRASSEPFKPAAKDDLAALLIAEQFKDFKVHQTRRYLYIYNTTDTFAAVASRILETMFPGVMTYAAAQKIDVHEPEVPLVVLMFRDEGEYRRHTGAPAGMLAFYSAVDNRVAMYENTDLSNVRPDLAAQQAVATIAHEGAHQILHNIGVQQRLSVWPMWISEGLAEFFAPTATDARIRWLGAGQVNDMRMFELEQYFKARPADADGHLIEDTVQAARLTSTGYATSWILTHYLAKNHRAEFHKYVNALSRLGPLEGDRRIVEPGVIRGNKTLFEEHFGEDYPAMEKRIVAHLNRLPYNDPFAASPHYVAMIVAPVGGRSRRDANIFRTEELAEKWQRETLESLAEESRRGAVLSVKRLGNKTAAQQFAVLWVRDG